MMFLVVALLASLGSAESKNNRRRSGRNWTGSFSSRGELEFCAESRSKRFLSETESFGHVLHINTGPHDSTLIPRAEVVAAVNAALEGQDDFEALELNAKFGELIVLTKDHMLYDNKVVTDPDGAFVVENAFVESDPGTYYKVHCPALSLGAMCEVIDDTPASLSRFGQCRMKEDHSISEVCLGSKYEVVLIAVEGPHFLLGASSTNTDCPNIAFDSAGGKRRSQFSIEDAAGVAVQHVGFASLRAILKAEKQAEEVNTTLLSFDMSTNTCVHYARDIWRRLGMTESASLAEFVIENVAGDPHIQRLAEILTLGGGMGGLRNLAARVITGGSNLVREKVEEAVYSQFIL